MAETSERYLAIDVFRGLTLWVMIIVNMSISETLSYTQLLHSPWNGLTLTDMVFPSFLFAVGASMAFSLRPNLSLPMAVFLPRIGRRALIIFLCGILVSNFPFFRFDTHQQAHFIGFESLRIFGVLQRIALCYGIGALVLKLTGRKGAMVYSVLALLVYWAVMATFGDYSLKGNAGLKLDLWLLGPLHLYKGEGIPFDPEGLLGTIPSTVNVLAGYMVADYLRHRQASIKLTQSMLIAGCALIGLSLLWNLSFPINKKLWTSSYVVCMIGIDLIVLGLLILGLDVWKQRKLVPLFDVMGKNTLAIYMVAEMSMAVAWTFSIGKTPLFMWIYNNGFHWAGDKPGALLFAIVFAALCWGLAYIMDRKGIYLRA